MTKKERALEAVRRLKEIYPMSDCTLEYDQPYRLLIAVRLAAQCTDARVNQITPILFERFPTLESLADADPKDVEAIVRPCGLGKTKARDIVSLCGMLIDQYDSQVPDSLEELLKLPGVGRKTANIVLNVSFGIVEGIAVDTHVNRIAHRLRLSPKTHESEPLKTEQDLLKVIPRELWGPVNHQWIRFGREVCPARSPHCDTCPMGDICPSAGRC